VTAAISRLSSGDHAAVYIKRLIFDQHLRAGDRVPQDDVASALGISRIPLLRDLSSTAVILEGWAFDPARTDEATGAVFPAGGASLRTYHEVQYVGVSSARQ